MLAYIILCFCYVLQYQSHLICVSGTLFLCKILRTTHGHSKNLGLTFLLYIYLKKIFFMFFNIFLINVYIRVVGPTKLHCSQPQQ